MAVATFLTLGAGATQAQLLDRSGTCNLARNAAFESVTLAPVAVHHWSLEVDSGAGSLSLQTYPEPVQSGDHAARVTVSQPGDLYLSTAEGGFTSIRVLADTEYRLSVRLLSDYGQQAQIAVAEWAPHSTTPTVVKILDTGGGSGEWATLEGSFTTETTTRTVSLRLLHALDAGDFTWDDPMLARVKTDEICVDLRHHRAQTTPGFKMCGPWINVGGVQKRWCHDAEKSILDELVRTTALFAFPDTFERGNFGVLLHNGTNDLRLGIHKNIDMTAGSRCFANPGKPCGPSGGANAHFPPHALRMISELPVIDLGTVPPSVYNQGTVTPGAKLDHNWQDFDVRSFDPQTGAQTNFIGNINRRQWAFVAASIDFGGDLGVQHNVLVIEEEQISGSIDPTTFGGGKNLERYWFVRGFGRAGQTVWKNTACAANPSAATCNGTYDTNPGGLLDFPYFGANDTDFSALPPVAPFNIVNWWLR